jgi:hypothetical protein
MPALSSGESQKHFSEESMNDAKAVVGLAMLAAVLCSPDIARAQQAKPAGNAVTAAQDSAAEAGRRVRRDPQTGEFIDGPVEAPAAPQARSARPQGAAPSIARPEEMNELMLQFMQRGAAQPMPGGRGLSLAPRHLSSTVVVRQADGSLASECVQGETAAEHRLHAPRVDFNGLKAQREVRHVQ